VSAELAKLRYLHLPRWTAAGVLAVAIAVGLALLIFPPGDPGKYASTSSFAMNITLTIAAIVFGVWIATLEFASGTWQRTLTAEPDRSAVLLAKLTVLLLGLVGLGLVAVGATIGLSDLAAARAGADVDQGDVARQVAAVLPPAIAAGVVGFGFGLLAGSMGGGIAVAFAFVFVLDGFLTQIPGLGDWTFGTVTSDIQAKIAGSGTAEHALLPSLLVALAWALAILAPGWWRLLRQDLK
jgi:ABC-2 type transport system permease protein